jgi:hypothetical protein
MSSPIHTKFCTQVYHEMGDMIDLVRFDIQQPFSRYREKTDERKPFGIFKKEPKIAILIWNSCEILKLNYVIYNNFFCSHTTNLNLMSIEI